MEAHLAFPLTKSVSISALQVPFFLHGDSWCPCDIILGGGQVQAFTSIIVFVTVLPSRPIDKVPTDPTFGLRKLQKVIAILGLLESVAVYNKRQVACF